MNDPLPIFPTHRIICNEIADELHLKKSRVFKTMGRIFSIRSGIPSFIQKKEPLYLRGYGTFRLKGSEKSAYFKQINRAQEDTDKLNAARSGKEGCPKGAHYSLQGFPIELANQNWKNLYQNSGKIERMRKKYIK